MRGPPSPICPPGSMCIPQLRRMTRTPDIPGREAVATCMYPVVGRASREGARPSKAAARRSTAYGRIHPPWNRMRLNTIQSSANLSHWARHRGRSALIAATTGNGPERASECKLSEWSKLLRLPPPAESSVK